MKKLFVVLVLTMGLMSAGTAQKIGYINTEDLMSIMPETAKADKEMGDYQEVLQKQGMEYAKDLQEKDSAYRADSAKMTPKMKEIAVGALEELYRKVSGWQQMMQNELQKMGQEKVQPIRIKAMDAIKAVAKQNGYAYVLDVTALLVAPPGDDILPLVKKHLGIKDVQAQPPAGGAPKPKQQ